MSEDEVGFDVNDEVIVGDLTDVRAEILPVTQNVKLRIDKASIAKTESGDLKGLKLELAIAEGIEVAGETKFVNKKVFTGIMDLCFYADPATRNSQWYKSKQHLLGFKQFMQALDLDITNVKINDEFLQGLVGREVMANITHEEDTVKDESGKRQKTGNFREKLKAWKKAA